MSITPQNLEVGGRYNWRNQPERLIYMGSMPYQGNGLWYQFAKVDKPDVCWSEVRAEDLSSFEVSDKPAAGLSQKTLKALAYESFSNAHALPTKQSDFKKNLAAMRLRKNLETLNKNLDKKMARYL